MQQIRTTASAIAPANQTKKKADSECFPEKKRRFSLFTKIGEIFTNLGGFGELILGASRKNTELKKKTPSSRTDSQIGLSLGSVCQNDS